jgi:hypothetical protein
VDQVELEVPEQEPWEVPEEEVELRLIMDIQERLREVEVEVLMVVVLELIGELPGVPGGL